MEPLGRIPLQSDYGAPAPEREQAHTLTVKEMSTDEQPRERALKFGIQSLTNAELLAIILRTGITGMPITEICRNIMRANENSFLQLERRSYEEFLLIEGVGPAKALQLDAVREIIRRYNREKPCERVAVLSPEVLYNEMRHEIGNIDHEEIWAVYLDNSNKILSKRMITSGTARCSVLDIKNIIKIALMIGAEGLAMAHNHPSGVLRPSVQDREITKKLRDACRAMDLRFVDHIIVTCEGFYSFSNETDLLR